MKTAKAQPNTQLDTISVDNMNIQKSIQQIYQFIKKDNLQAFLDTLNKNPSIIEFHNKKNENILFYALNKGSLSISQWLIEHYPSLFSEQNNEGLTPLSCLILHNDKEGFDCLEHIFSNKNQLLLQHTHAIASHYGPVIELAISKLDSHLWKKYESLCSSYWTTSQLSKTDENGYNLLHHIAFNNALHCKNLISRLPDNLYLQSNYQTGSTPFLIACFHGQKELVELLAQKSMVNAQDNIGNNILHMASQNIHHDVLPFLIDQGVDYEKNHLDESPLLYAINEFNGPNSLGLLKQYPHEDISEELLQASKHCNKHQTFWTQCFAQITEENFIRLSHDDNLITQFFSNLFYYGNQEIIQSLEQSPLWNLLDNISHQPFLMHQIYNSSIMNRKSMSVKINLLLEKGDFLHADESDSYYKPNIQKDLSFTSNHDVFQKNHRSFCLVASLSTLPNPQLIEILTNTSIVNHMDNKDLLLLFSIGIKRHSQTIIDFAKHRLADTTHIISGSNLDYGIQDNLSQFYPKDHFNGYFTQALEKFGHVPSYMLQGIALKVSEKNHATVFFSHILKIFKDYPLYKKNVVSSLVESLLQVEEPHPALINLFKNKDNIVENVLFSFGKKSPELLNDNGVLDNLLERTETNKKYWDVVQGLMTSENENKHELIKKLLPHARLTSKEDYFYMKNLLTEHIDDQSWRLLLNHAYKTRFFQSVLCQYFNQQSLHPEQANIKTLDLAWNLLEKKYATPKKWFFNAISQFDGNHYSSLSFFENLCNKKEADKYFVCYQALNNKTPSYLINKPAESIDLNAICFYWEKNLLNDNAMVLNMMFENYEPLDNYLELINKHPFPEQFYNNFAQHFHYWLVNGKQSADTKIIVALKTFDAIKGNSEFIEDKTLSDICLSMVKINQQKHNGEFIQLMQTHSFKQFLDLAFQNRNEEFFLTLIDSPYYQLLQNDLSNVQQKQLNYYNLDRQIQSETDNEEDEPDIARIKI
jgi:hypothetical protein